MIRILLKINIALWIPFNSTNIYEVLIMANLHAKNCEECIEHIVLDYVGLQSGRGDRHE